MPWKILGSYTKLSDMEKVNLLRFGFWRMSSGRLLTGFEVKLNVLSLSRLLTGPGMHVNWLFCKSSLLKRNRFPKDVGSSLSKLLLSHKYSRDSRLPIYSGKDVSMLFSKRAFLSDYNLVNESGSPYN